MRIMGIVALVMVIGSGSVSHGKVIAHWSFNEGSGNIINDLSGSGYDGLQSNVSNWGASTEAKVGASCFVQVSGRNCAEFPGTPLDGMLRGAVDFWFMAYQHGSGTGNEASLLTHADGINQDDISIVEYQGELSVGFRDDGGVGIGTGFDVIQLNQWYHVRLELTGSEYRLYLDGRLVGTATQNLALGTKSFIRVGNGAYGNSCDNQRPLYGRIDEIKIEQLPAGEWRSRHPMLQAKYSACCVALNGKVYVIGGFYFDGNHHPLATVEEYNPTTDSWRTRASMPAPRFACGSAVLNGKIYVIGGHFNDGSGPQYLSSVEVYDPVLDSWTSLSPLPAARSALACVALNGRIYAIGGDQHPQYYSRVDVYDPVGNTWSSAADMLSARSNLTAEVVAGRIYAIGGGQVGDNVFTDVVEVYDPVDNVWSSGRPMPTARAQLCSGVVNGLIYAIGGYYRDTGDQYLAATEEYDPVTDIWRRREDMPTGRLGAAAASLNGSILVVGGDDDDITGTFGGLDIVEEYDLIALPSEPDTDGDGVVDPTEQIHPPMGKTNLYLPDSDGDGLADGIEDGNRNGFHWETGETDPRDRDSDSDGYCDGIEVLLLNSDPLRQEDPSTPYVDMDGDELSLSLALDPNDSEVDTDDDRTIDGYEAVTLGLAACSDSALRPPLGDVDRNANWDNADAQIILNFFASLDTAGVEEAPDRMDIERNGNIDNADAQLSLNYFGHNQECLPVILP